MHQELGSTTHFYYCAWRHGEALFARRRLYVSQQWPAHRQTSKCTGALHCALFSPSWFVHDSNENDWVANDTAEAGVLPSTSVDMPSDPHDLCSASIAVEVWTCMKRPQRNSKPKHSKLSINQNALLGSTICEVSSQFVTCFFIFRCHAGRSGRQRTKWRGDWPQDPAPI